MSAWKDFVTTSLLGTERGGETPAIPTVLEEVLGPAANLEPAARFLTRAGALALWQRAGWKPADSASALPPPAPPESTPLIPPASVAHLQMMLGGHHDEILPEWLSEAARREKRVPPEWLPALLEWARQHRAARPLAMAAGRSRIRWLAGQNPKWNFAADDSPEHWETGNREQRLAILRGWRASDPAKARGKLQAVWSREPAEARAALLASLAEGLDEADAPFLEGALDDRSKEVRQVAVDLLARLPGSPFAGRMVARAEPLLTFKRGGLLSRATLAVVLPADPDAAAVRDGLDPKAFGPQKLLGDKAVLLTLLLAAVPLRRWTDAWQLSPAELLKAAGKSDYADALSTGWALAAFRQREGAWAEALLDAPVAPYPALLSYRSLFELLPEPARAARLVSSLRGGVLAAQNNYQSWQALSAQIDTFSGELPAVLARELVNTLRHLQTGDRTLPPAVWAFATPWFLKVPAAMLSEAINGWSADQTYPAQLVSLIELLTFRHDALAALSQP